MVRAGPLLTLTVHKAHIELCQISQRKGGNSIKKSPSEVDTGSAGQEILRLLWNPNNRSRVSFREDSTKPAIFIITLGYSPHFLHPNVRILSLKQATTAS